MNNQIQLILATDLDGTFLEGDDYIRQLFYGELLRLREHIVLIYVTGRPITIVKQFCLRGYLPQPDFVIGDHGTHIVDGLNFNIVEQLQTPIIQKWMNGNTLLKNLLSSEDGIQLQPLDTPYRVAYYYDPDYLKDETLQKINMAGYDYILSCDAYLDIVPKGINKGSTLLNLLDILKLNHESVVTCGDSLNDLSLFQTGLKSIAVGNSEPKLINEVKTLTNVFQSTKPGLYGIMEGLGYYKKLGLNSSI
jgi:HAD superfamily hydrolase (TIGR01484 family)